MASRILVCAWVVATVAFASYARTLLPGVDLGDTGGFQAAVLWPEISARQAYPLYYALAKPFVGALSPANPARGLNLFSAVGAAAAAGLLTGVVAHVTRSLTGGAVAGLLLAFSYTFWTQAVIAEVYSLHLALLGVCLAALAAWQQRRSTQRLAIFFGVYALAFGNHLSMILLLVPFAAFLLLSAERRSDLMRGRVIAMAAAISFLGALQYVPHLQAIWTSIDAPERWSGRMAAFWFDVTKADWRESMVLGVRAEQLWNRAALFAFDARQQFGIAGLAMALAGAAALWRASRAWAALVVLGYAVNTAFAFTYNVGDPHVFFLPGHYFTAFAAGAATARLLQGMRRRRVALAAVTAAALAYVAWRGYDTWPAADRHADRRAEQLVARLTLGLDERDALLATELNWQVENALLYETRYSLRHVVWIRLSDVLLHFPLLVRDNQSGGRDVVLTAAAVPRVAGAFGSLLPMVADAVPPTTSLAAYASRVPRGAPYTLAVLTAERGEAIDEAQLQAAFATLTGGQVLPPRPLAPYEVWVGRAGSAPLLHRSDVRPYRHKLRLAEGELDIRFDGWVPLETFRRGGFGHVTIDRRHVLTIERGVSLAAIDAGQAYYAHGLYALQPRFRIPSSGVPELALLH